MLPLNFLGLTYSMLCQAQVPTSSKSSNPPELLREVDSARLTSTWQPESARGRRSPPRSLAGKEEERPSEEEREEVSPSVLEDEWDIESRGCQPEGFCSDEESRDDRWGQGRGRNKHTELFVSETFYKGL